MKLTRVILLLGMLLASGPAIAQERSGRDAKIRHELATFPGTHDGALRQRIEEHMFPLLWQVFSEAEGSR